MSKILNRSFFYSVAVGIFGGDLVAILWLSLIMVKYADNEPIIT